MIIVEIATATLTAQGATFRRRMFSPSEDILAITRHLARLFHRPLQLRQIDIRNHTIALHQRTRPSYHVRLLPQHPGGLHTDFTFFLSHNHVHLSCCAGMLFIVLIDVDRRRQPLPPQTTTFMSAPPGRDPPPQAPPPQPEPPKVKTAGWANFDPTLPRQPKFETRGAQRNVQAAQGGNVFEQAKRESEERSRYFREKALADMEKSRLAMEAMAASVPKPLNTGTPKPKPSVVSTPVFDPDRRNNVTTPQERDRQEFVQRPPKLDTRMDIDPRDVADMRRPASPRGMRSMRPRQDDEERYPGGPRSAISTHTPTPRAVFPASIVPPPNARYENGYSAGLPPPRDINPGDDRRFNEHRPEWRDNRTGDVYPERGPMV